MKRTKDGATMDLFGLGDRAVARRTDPDTSHDAADSVSRQDILLTQRRILQLLAEYGTSTDEDIAQTWRWGLVSPSGLRTRRSELVARGLVFWTGEKDKMRTGRMARVWGITSAGRHALVGAHRG